MRGVLLLLATVCALATGPALADRREVFPHVFVDADAGVVEIAGTVPIDTKNEAAPDVYLEVILCARGSKEHEALVMTDALASHVHAALLLINAEPGSPGAVPRGGDRISPTGEALRVELVTLDGEGNEFVHDPRAWVRRLGGGTLAGVGRDPDRVGWVFAGSRMTERQGAETYDADGTGLIVGLHTFGSEVIAFETVWSPDSGLDEPEWLAANDAVPAQGTPVAVRLSRVDAAD